MADKTEELDGQEPRTIVISEYEDYETELNADDAVFISRELKDKIYILRNIRGRCFTLSACQFVGLVALPSGVVLKIVPKIPVSNLFYMLSVVFQIPPIRPELVVVEQADEILEVAAIYFAGLVEKHIQSGLYRWYVEKEDNLESVRGRISFAGDLQRNFVQRQRTYCRFEELTWDIPENQVVRQVCHSLSGWRFRRDTRVRLSQLDAELADVTRTNFTSKVFDNIHYHRLNQDYRQVHQFCRLFLDGSSFSDKLGTLTFRAFLLDMNKLFEDFVCQILRERIFGSVNVATQDWINLDSNQKVPMRPDIVVRGPDSVLLVADCKYKKLEHGGANNSDIYQLLAYCIATGTEHGLIIYPKYLDAVGDVIQVLNTEIDIRLTGIDLSQELKMLKNSCDEFADFVITAAANSNPSRSEPRQHGTT